MSTDLTRQGDDARVDPQTAAALAFVAIFEGSRLQIRYRDQQGDVTERPVFVTAIHADWLSVRTMSDGHRTMRYDGMIAVDLVS